MLPYTHTPASSLTYAAAQILAKIYPAIYPVVSAEMFEAVSKWELGAPLVQWPVTEWAFPSAVFVDSGAGGSRLKQLGALSASTPS